MNRFGEIGEELRQVLGGRLGAMLDAALPPLAYLLGRQLCCADLGLRLAVLAALLVVLIRLMLRQSIAAALAGLAIALGAAALATVSVQAANFFLPGLLSSGLVAGLSILSLVLNKPLAAWSSYLARSWPLDWYWHPQVAPAYRNVTAAWSLVFLARFLLQYAFYVQGAASALGAAQLLLGWPLIIVLLIGTYLYGTWKLRRLGGPSVQEFRDGAPPPWQSQVRGF